MINNKLLTSTKQGKIEPAIVVADSGNRLTTIDINKNKCYRTMVGGASTHITYITYLDGVWCASGYNDRGGINYISKDALHWVYNNSWPSASGINSLIPNPLTNKNVYPYHFYGGIDGGYDKDSDMIIGASNLQNASSTYSRIQDNAIPIVHTYNSKNNSFIIGCATYTLNSDSNDDADECLYIIQSANNRKTVYRLKLDDTTTNLDGLDYRCTLAQPEYVESEDMFYMAVKVINWSTPAVFDSGTGIIYTMVFKSPTAYSNSWTKIADRTEDGVTIFHNKLSSIVYNKLIDKSLIFSQRWNIHLSNKKLGDGLLKFDDLVKLPNLPGNNASNFIVPYKDGFIRFTGGSDPYILTGDMTAWETLETSISFSKIKYVCSNEEYFI